MDFDISAYHDYKIVGQGSTASFYVDGTLVATNWFGQSHSSKTVTWGNGCSSTKGVSAYHTINLSIADNQQFYFDASLMERVNGIIIKHPAEQGWTKTSTRNGRGDPGWKSINAGPGQGIQLTSGRLIFPAIILDVFTQLSVVSIYSDDYGVTWHAGNQTPTYALEPSEADMVELNDGRLLMSARNDGVTGTGNFNSYHFVSSDRNDLAIWSAVDDGAGNYNFTQRTQFRDGYSAYSDLIQLQDKGASGNEDIGVIYEATSSTEIRFMVLDIDSVN